MDAIDARVKAIITQVPAFGADLASVDEDGALFATIQMIVSHDDKMEGACSELLSGMGSEVEVAYNGIPIWGEVPGRSGACIM